MVSTFTEVGGWKRIKRSVGFSILFLVLGLALTRDMINSATAVVLCRNSPFIFRSKIQKPKTTLFIKLQKYDREYLKSKHFDFLKRDFLESEM